MDVPNVINLNQLVGFYFVPPVCTDTSIMFKRYMQSFKEGILLGSKLGEDDVIREILGFKLGLLLGVKEGILIGSELGKGNGNEEGHYLVLYLVCCLW